MPTVTIPLTQGKVAFVDAADLPLVAPHTWCAVRKEGGLWYASTQIPTPAGPRRQRILTMHKLILDCPPGKVVDHRDRNGLNNVRSNLRIATNGQNRANSAPKVREHCAYKGVSWDTTPFRRNRWRACVRSQGKTLSLGYFTTAEDAARAYDAKARELFGEFARCNFPENIK